MAMIRVPPGTIPKAQARDYLREHYQREQLGLNRKKALDIFEDLEKDPAIKELLGRSRNENNPGRFSRKLVEPPQEPKEEQENLYKNPPQAEKIAFSNRRPSGYWGKDPEWQKLSSYEKAAAMALLEADSKGGKIDVTSARNALGAMINRADKEGEDLGEHVSRKIYQPTIEPLQYSRLQDIMKRPEFQAMTSLAEKRDRGEVDDWVQGATHFLAKPEVMLGLEAEDPKKYRSWRKWTGFDESTGRYSNEVMADNSHVFLAPEGRHTANRAPMAREWTGEMDSAAPTASQSFQPTTAAGAAIGTASETTLGSLFGGGRKKNKFSSNPIPLPAGIDQMVPIQPVEDQSEFGMPPPPPRTPPHLPVPAQLPGARQQRLGAPSLISQYLRPTSR